MTKPPVRRPSAGMPSSTRSASGQLSTKDAASTDRASKNATNDAATKDPVTQGPATTDSAPKDDDTKDLPTTDTATTDRATTDAAVSTSLPSAPASSSTDEAAPVPEPAPTSASDASGGTGGMARASQKLLRASRRLIGRSGRLVGSSVVTGAVVVVVVAIVGAVIGAAVGMANSAFTSSAVVFVAPTPTLDNTAPTPTTQDANDLFIGGQVATVSSLTQSLHGASVAVSQVGLSNVLQIAATADTKRAAESAANTVLDRYIALRKRQVRSYAATASARVQAQLDQDVTQIAAASSTTAAGKAQRSALGSDYSRLLGVQRQVELNEQTATPTSIVHRARAIDTVSASNAVRDAILGLLLGAVLAVGFVALLRRRAPASGRP